MWWSKYRGILDYLTRSKDNKKIKELVLSNRKNKEEREYACYYILKEKKDGSVEIVKKLVPYNKAIMDASIKSSSLPHKEPILKMTK